MNNQFEIAIGPLEDCRLFQFKLPTEPTRVGVLVSGGLDSAILYYLLEKLNKNNFHKITPYIIARQEGSLTYGPKVIEYVNNLFNKNPTEFEIIEIPKLIPPHLQVKIAVQMLRVKKVVDILYLGVISVRAEHSIGIDVYRPKEDTDFVKYPLFQLEKSHIVDLICKMEQEKLIEITSSCDSGNNCGNCNGCKERSWGLSQIIHNNTLQ